MKENEGRQLILLQTNHNGIRPLDILQKRPRFPSQSFQQYGGHIDSHRQQFSGERTRAFHGHYNSHSQITENKTKNFYFHVLEIKPEISRICNAKSWKT